ncbi:MAG: hypothetical protein KKF30_19025 [Proteobacteria bacterium]|nr:hypothetical protein [Pseudomonadota bacterium]
MILAGLGAARFLIHQARSISQLGAFEMTTTLTQGAWLRKTGDKLGMGSSIIFKALRLSLPLHIFIPYYTAAYEHV